MFTVDFISEDTPSFLVQRVLGAVHGSYWTFFDNFHSYDLGLMSVLAQQMTIIRNSLAQHLTNYDFGSHVT